MQISTLLNMNTSIVQMPLDRIESSFYRARDRLHEPIDRIVGPLKTIALF